MSNFSCLGDPVTVACLNLGEAVLTIASMLTVMLIIILGNLLVVVTVYRDRKLRLQRQNWLIISLALADLLVGLLVMPLTLIYEIIGEWKMGVSWVVSLLICLPPIFGWRPERRPGECAVSTDIGYVLYSSLGSFYIPVIILVIVYAKIYSITIKHSRQRLKETERRDNTLSLLTAKPSTKQIVELELLEENSDGDEKDNSTNKEAINQVCWHLRKISEELPTVKLKKVSATQRILHTFDPKRVVLPKSEKELNAEKRNSGINPVIYTVFNREFKRGLCRQLRKFERYVEPITDFYK
ncbi:7 transmembrane receptor [Ancylostoma duodenale]|uniref:7 transmembrane receptor n=1 Tax=Ancylostoma duodenale TaxID=51022 RepID=A0A0C2H9U1_9BILA|nr:7 transmembrane receptor [Ancylostoma duodenale]